MKKEKKDPKNIPSYRLYQLQIELNYTLLTAEEEVSGWNVYIIEGEIDRSTINDKIVEERTIAL